MRADTHYIHLKDAVGRQDTDVEQLDYILGFTIHERFPTEFHLAINL